MPKLSYPHYTQMDNDTHLHGGGYRQCNLTVHAMFLDGACCGMAAVGAARNRMNEPESWLGFHLKKYGDTTDHNALTRCFKDVCNVDSYWTKTLSQTELKRALDTGYAVPCGVRYKGGGHIVLVVGYNEKGVWVHDPYGQRDGSNDYYPPGKIGGHHGEYDYYQWATFGKIFFDEQGTDNSHTGWARVVERIGVSVGPAVSTGITEEERLSPKK